MEDLKQKLQNEFNVTLGEVSISATENPTVVLHFKNEHTRFIERNPEVYDLKYFKIKAEGIAHLQNWTFPNNVIEDALFLTKRPYTIEIKAVNPLIYAFVLAILIK